ncbi:MAG: CoA transferase [Chloroflexi bacterium]|nr:CoA transferase [Chloroflexota bacterium]
MAQSEARVAAIPRALDGVRVVDFTWVRAGPWAGRWLGALGAQIIKVEWPLREIGRTFLIQPGEQPNFNASGNFNDTNVNKLSITLNVRTPKGMDLIKRLISISDVVIENYSSRVMRDWGLGYDELCKLRPDIIYVSLAGFGHTGRHHHYTTWGPSAQALSGMTHLSGLPGKPPAGWGWSYLDDTGGMYGAMGVLTALHHRNMTGQGQHVDIAQMIMGVTLNGPAILDATVNGRASRREGYPPGNRAHWPGTPLFNNYRGPTVAPHNSYRTRGGGYNDWCVIVCLSDQEWQHLVKVMGSPGWAADARFATQAGRLQHQEELDRGIEQWTLTLEKYEVMERCQAAGVRAMPVQSNEDRVEHDPQLGHRGMYLEMEHAELGVKKLQNAPFKLTESPAVNSLPGPLIGEHNQQVFEGLLGLSHEELVAGYDDETIWPKSLNRYPYMDEMLRNGPIGRRADHLLLRGHELPSPSPIAVGASAETAGGGPFAGLRVLELADEKGQWCGKLMADLGAEVIKVEPPGGEKTRGVGPYYQDVPHRERSISFWHYNTSKRGVTLNLETEDGRRLFRRLAATADIVLETFAPGYLASLGLGYDGLKKDNPRLIMCSLTSFGQTGPWKDYLDSDLLHLAAGGQMGCCGYDDDDVPGAPPIAPGGGQAWHMAGHYAYIAIVAALIYRAATGKGQYIDASAHDACALTTEMHIATWIYDGKVPLRHTGRHASPGPSPKLQHLCSDGRYLITAALRLPPAQLRVVAEWMDGYGLADDLMDEKYRDGRVIQGSMPHIVEVITRFVTSLTSEEIYNGAQERGFPWGAIRSPDELLEDGQMQDRGFWVNVEHPEIGRTFTYPGTCAIYGRSPWSISRRAPRIGEHNEEVFCGEMGLSRQELSLLAENGAV